MCSKRNPWDKYQGMILNLKLHIWLWQGGSDLLWFFTSWQMSLWWLQMPWHLIDTWPTPLKAWHKTESLKLRDQTESNTKHKSPTIVWYLATTGHVTSYNEGYSSVTSSLKNLGTMISWKYPSFARSHPNITQDFPMTGNIPKIRLFLFTNPNLVCVAQICSAFGTFHCMQYCLMIYML